MDAVLEECPISSAMAVEHEPASISASSGAAGSGQQGHAQVESVRRLLHRRLKVGVSDGRVFVGRFHCLDKQGNLILFDTHEFVPRRHFPPPFSPATPDAVAAPDSQVPDVSAPQQAAEQRGSPATSPHSSELSGRATTGAEPAVMASDNSIVSARDAEEDGHPRQDLRDGSGGRHEDGAQGDGSGGHDRTSPAAEASPPVTGSATSLLPPAPAHPVSLEPGPGQPRSGARGRKEGEASPELVEQRRLGLVLIPLHARVSCQLECDLDEDLSFLSLSDDS